MALEVSMGKLIRVGGTDERSDVTFTTANRQESHRMMYHRIKPGECVTPRDVLVRSIESGAGEILIEADALPPSFFDLSSGAAGEIVQGAANYRIRTAAVVPEMARHSDAFQAFAKEASRGHMFRFFESEAAADRWLRGDEVQ